MALPWPVAHQPSSLPLPPQSQGALGLLSCVEQKNSPPRASSACLRHTKLLKPCCAEIAFNHFFNKIHLMAVFFFKKMANLTPKWVGYVWAATCHQAPEWYTVYKSAGWNGDIFKVGKVIWGKPAEDSLILKVSKRKNPNQKPLSIGPAPKESDRLFSTGSA